MFGNKGIIFIIDFILVVAIVVFALVLFSNIKQKESIKYKNDLVYLESSVFYGASAIQNKGTNYICNDFNVYIIKQGLEIIEKKVCTIVVK